MTTPAHRALIPRTRCSAAVVLLVVSALVAGALAFAHASPARAAASRLHPGLGAWITGHTDFVGSYRALVGRTWTTVYCIDPARRAPTSIGLTTVVRVPGLSTTASRDIAETLAAHGAARSAATAEAVSQAVNFEAGNHAAVARRAHRLRASVQRTAMAWVAEAHRLRGPYALALSVSGTPLPGQSTTLHVSLRSGRSGRPGTVRLRHGANVRMPATIRVGGTGRASAAITTVGTGTVHISASAGSLPPTTLRVSHAGGSVQRMVSWSPRRSVHASVSYRGRTQGLSERYACTSVCDGHPIATLSACAAPSRYPSRLVLHIGATRSYRVFSASARRICTTWTRTLADRDHVSAGWQWRVGGRWSAEAPAAGAFTVDCPPAPPLALIYSADCSSASLTAVIGRVVDGSLLAAHNTGTHRMVLDVSGGAHLHVILAPGATDTPHAFALACGKTTTVSVRAGVQRAGGTYNYGRTTRILFP